MSSISDPSYGVNRDLLPHVHLMSTYRYTFKAQVQPQEVTAWLMQAPKIARDTAPFFWTYVDRPEHGHISLNWQPLQLMGTNYASDGFIWPAQESYYQQEVGNGVILEMYYHKAGFAYGEPMATHSRRRFRLIPPNAPNPNAPQVDPSLWIVHYGPIDHNERIPSQAIRGDARTASILETRLYLQRCGQIQRKEFILGDRVNWPQISWPRELSRQQMYPANRGVPQAMAYPAHPPGAGGPPSKRSRTNQSAHGQIAPMAAIAQSDSTYDDDEDTSRGDLFDHMTPRDISLVRYRQNHEWMEEILSSPYRMDQIGFADLGLGLKGELSGLTDGIYESYGPEATTKPSSKPATTHLDPELASEFTKRVTDRIDFTKADIEKMKADHAKKMAKFKRNSLLTTAERELRSAIDDAGEDGLLLEGQVEESEEGVNQWPSKHTKKVEDIVAQVEAHLGRQAEVIHDLKRIHKGGYQEPAPEPAPDASVHQPSAGGPQIGVANGSNTMSRQPSHAGSQQSGFMIGDSDIDMGGTAAGLLDQMHAGGSSTSTPQPQLSAAQSSAATPANLNVPSPRPPHPQASGTAAKQGVDAKMDGTGATTGQPAGTAPDQGTGSGDWVVVPKGGATTPDAGAGSAAAAAAAAASGAPPTKAAAGNASKQDSAMGTPSMGFEGDQNDFSELDDLNSAGDALAEFGAGDDDGGMDEEGMDMSMDDSAFGDAFHGVETRGGGDTPADSNS
ncbi:Uu.00g019860.m01.CDS01 [Anthostomella pinea]|uniref:Uu.00g019860.m01.CDS01 n=1 Tax=Anthostomella pinea TaxID=933095 RepID=A0AAI8VZE0_9PEZI|nr:Uu.00g019860.m01.CDS01 [Anthostomella pinea]